MASSESSIQSSASEPDLFKWIDPEDAKPSKHDVKLKIKQLLLPDRDPILRIMIRNVTLPIPVTTEMNIRKSHMKFDNLYRIIVHHTGDSHEQYLPNKTKFFAVILSLRLEIVNQKILNAVLEVGGMVLIEVRFGIRVVENLDFARFVMAANRASADENETTDPDQRVSTSTHTVAAAKVPSLSTIVDEVVLNYDNLEAWRLRTIHQLSRKFPYLRREESFFNPATADEPKKLSGPEKAKKKPIKPIYLWPVAKAYSEDESDEEKEEKKK